MFSLDSLGIERVGAAERVQQYLAMEWQANYPDQPARTFNRMPLHCPKVGSANSTGKAVTVNTDSLPPSSPPFPSDPVSNKHFRLPSLFAPVC